MVNREFSESKAANTLKLILSRSLRIPFEDDLRSDFLQEIDFLGKKTLPTFNVIRVLGKMSIWGLELEAAYNRPGLRIGLSHTYTKLISFSLRDPTTIQPFSAEPYGFGDDLAN